MTEHVSAAAENQIDGFTLGVAETVAALAETDAARAAGSTGTVALAAAARERCAASRTQVTAWLGDDAPVVYGINTGLGNLKDVVLSPSEHVEWNATIPYPHAAGLGDYIHPNITRTALLIRANVLARGYSGARPALIDRLLALYNAGVAPAIRELASVGLSDLAPLAHVAMVASGIAGARVVVGDEVVAAQPVLEAAGLPARFQYECKDTLSTMNGASMTQAAGVLVVHSAELLLQRADRLAAVDVDVEAGSESAAFIASVWAAFGEVRATLDTECNVSCDNPLLFEVGDEYEAVMGCNCSNTQVGYDLDLLCVLLAERAALIVGHQIAGARGSAAAQIRDRAAQVMQRLSDAALPASADSLPTKSGQEDHVEFSYGAARKAYESVQLFRDLLALAEVAVGDSGGEPSGASLRGAISARAELVSAECAVIPFQVRLSEASGAELS